MPQSKRVEKCYGSLRLYNDSTGTWTRLHPTQVGDMKYAIHVSDHQGWMICDGRSLLRTRYSELYNIIGTTYGSVDGTHFNIPDCRSRVLGGIGQGSGLSNRTAGTLIGSETHTLTIQEMPSHTHTINDPGHSHSYVDNRNDQSVNTLTTQETAADNADISQTTGTSTTGITLNTTGNSQAFDIMQPTAFVGNIFIFADDIDKKGIYGN